MSHLRLADERDLEQHSVTAAALTREKAEERIFRLVEIPAAEALSELIDAQRADDPMLTAAVLKKIASIGHLARGIALAIEAGQRG